MDALYKVRLDWDRRRDYFTASIGANQLNRKRLNATDKLWSAEDLLRTQYVMPKESVIITDLDRGAAGGESLRAGLKDLTEKRKRKQSKLKPHA